VFPIGAERYPLDYNSLDLWEPEIFVSDETLSSKRNEHLHTRGISSNSVTASHYYWYHFISRKSLIGAGSGIHSQAFSRRFASRRFADLQICRFADLLIYRYHSADHVIEHNDRVTRGRYWRWQEEPLSSEKAGDSVGGAPWTFGIQYQGRLTGRLIQDISRPGSNFRRTYSIGLIAFPVFEFVWEGQHQSQSWSAYPPECSDIRWLQIGNQDDNPWRTG
jgi:hypothetical protein